MGTDVKQSNLKNVHTLHKMLQLAEHNTIATCKSQSLLTSITEALPTQLTQHCSMSSC